MFLNNSLCCFMSLFTHSKFFRGASTIKPKQIVGPNSAALVMSHLKLFSQRKAISFSFPYSKKLIPVLRCLQSTGFIQNFLVHQHYFASNYSEKPITSLTHSFLIYPKYVKGRPTATSIKIWSTSRRKYAIPYKSIKKINLSQPNTVFILLTSKGVLTSTECLRFRIGGIALCTAHG